MKLLKEIKDFVKSISEMNRMFNLRNEYQKEILGIHEHKMVKRIKRLKRQETSQKLSRVEEYIKRLKTQNLLRNGVWFILGSILIGWLERKANR